MLGYEALKKFTYERWVRLYQQFINYSEMERGHLTGEGLHRPDKLKNIANHCLTMASAQYDPYQIAALVIKEIVGEPMSADRKPLIFADGNRRMSLVYASAILEHFDRIVDVESPKSIKFKEKVRFMNVQEVERWLRTHSMAFKAPLPINRPKTRLDIRANHASYSSSVIKGKYTDPDINTLGWQLHAEGVVKGVIDDARPLFYERGWEVEARPSRIAGRFDMWIRRGR